MVVLLGHLDHRATALRAPLMAVLARCDEAELLCYIPFLVHNLHSEFWVGTHASQSNLRAAEEPRSPAAMSITR